MPIVALKKIAKNKAKVIICPESNLRVGQVPLNPEVLNKFGVSWFVATDGLGTGGTLNLQQQAKTLKKLFKNVSYQDLLRSITQNPLNNSVDERVFQNQEIAKNLIENCESQLYNKFGLKNLLKLKIVSKKLKKFKPILKDFYKWKGENYD